MWIQENENERLWKDFKEDIKYKSRFFPKSELLKKVDNVSDYASLELSKGTLLYRAREYTEAYFFKNREVIAFYQKLNEFFPHLKLQLEDIGSESSSCICKIKNADILTNLNHTYIKTLPYLRSHLHDCSFLI